MMTKQEIENAVMYALEQCTGRRALDDETDWAITADIVIGALVVAQKDGPINPAIARDIATTVERKYAADEDNDE